MPKASVDEIRTHECDRRGFARRAFIGSGKSRVLIYAGAASVLIAFPVRTALRRVDTGHGETQIAEAEAISVSEAL
ncbi:hypothetical protein [Agreia sp.]|uniref:hypothetical protein n=1 Tax=Agreia sp. TaxID=1872416 RepID=UPI0035BC321B